MQQNINLVEKSKILFTLVLNWQFSLMWTISQFRLISTLACLYQLQIQFHRARKWAAIKLYVNCRLDWHQVELANENMEMFHVWDKLDYGK